LNSIARMPANARAELFAETADRKGLADAIVEKDFWVCWVLKQLFSIEALSGRLLFKGGTSLSKIFHAINRFSEDIDLAVDYTALGFTGDRDPRRENLSKTKRAVILEEMMVACRRYISGEFLAALMVRCAEILGKSDAWSLHVSEQDANIVQFRYPTATAKSLAYVSPQVVLELGTHAEFVPHDNFTIRSFAAEEFPNVVADGDVAVIALLAKRTFWE
jgi:Nucleotidyl transferase AbiEii toxin, Type IV TA system